MDIIKDFISTPVIGKNFDTIAEDAAKKTEGTNVLGMLTPKNMIP